MTVIRKNVDAASVVIVRGRRQFDCRAKTTPWSPQRVLFHRSLVTITQP